MEFVTAIKMSEGTQYRPMKYPYTFLGKISQFPYKYYYQHSWLFKHTVFALLITVPLFYKIQKLCKYILYRSAIYCSNGIHTYNLLLLFSAYNPENVKKWEKIHREMFEGTGHH